MDKFFIFEFIVWVLIQLRNLHPNIFLEVRTSARVGYLPASICKTPRYFYATWWNRVYLSRDHRSSSTRLLPLSLLLQGRWNLSAWVLILNLKEICLVNLLKIYKIIVNIPLNNYWKLDSTFSGLTVFL